VSEERFFCEECQIEWLAEYSLWNMYTAECPGCGAACRLFDESYSPEPGSDSYDRCDEPGSLADSRDLEAVSAGEAADLAADIGSADDAGNESDGNSDGNGGEGK
jgi:hypothetical protein